jgi:DNA-binding NarL/FixJ family response regulator
MPWIAEKSRHSALVEVVRPTTVAVVHSSPMIRAALGDLLNRQAEVIVLGLFATAADLLDRPYGNDWLLLYDFMTARQDGEVVISQLGERIPRDRILVFGVPDDEQAIVDCVRLRPSGCMMTDASLNEILASLRGIAAGEPPVSSRVALSVIRYVAGGTGMADHPQLTTFTDRERQVLDLMVEGFGNREIAERLFVQPQTVRNYVHMVLQKLNVSSRLEIIRLLRAHERGAAGPSTGTVVPARRQAV